MRPANLVTAVADILAGIAISGYLVSGDADWKNILLLAFATLGLYGGGVVMNDVFDADLDRVERPERPIPSGLVSITEAASLGVILLLAGIGFAFLVNATSGLIATATAISAVVYDKWGKHHSFLGPLNMGLCRGLNLLLGISVIPSQPEVYWFLALVPIVYIAAITMISRGEVHGGSRGILYLAVMFYLVVMAAIIFAGYRNDEFIITSILVLGWAWMVFVPLKNAIGNPQGRMIGKAVKAGVIALILMNAAWAAAFGFPLLALFIVVLLPLSIFLAKAFAVT